LTQLQASECGVASWHAPSRYRQPGTCYRALLSATRGTHALTCWTE